MRNTASQDERRAASDWKKLRPRVTASLLARIRDRIVRAFHPNRIILFGSYAYGRPNIWSDVDLLVEMPSHQSMARRIMRVARVAHERFLPMDVLVFTPAEIQKRLAKEDPFLQEVMSRGKVLYARGNSR